MPWVKKNLTLVLGGLVGLLLLGGTGFFLYAEMRREAEIDQQLQAQQEELSRLNRLKPFPEDRNIQATKEEAARLTKLAETLRENIRPAEVPAVTNTFELRLLIEDTIAALTHEAEQSGVMLPQAGYAFTFQRLREMGGQFPSNAIPQIAEQVAHISTLARVLYDAKVHMLNSIRRSPVLKEEGGGTDYLTKKPLTNNLVVRTPYDISFTAFSRELGDVIAGLAALPECVSIKTVNIDPTTIPKAGARPMPGYQPMTSPGSGPGMDPELARRYGLTERRNETAAGGMDRAMRERYGLTGPSGSGGMDAAMRDRYGLGPQRGGDAAMRDRYGLGGGAGNRYGGGGAAAPYTAPQSLAAPYSPPTLAPAAAAGRGGPPVALDERPLRVFLQLDFVKPRPEGAAGRAAPARPAPAYSAEDGSADAAASGGDAWAEETAPSE